MAAFDQTRLLHLKKYLHCALLKLKRIKFALQRRKRIMLDSENQRQSLTQMYLNIDVLENFTNFTVCKYIQFRKHLCWSLFFNKVASLQLYYKTLQHRCFPLNFAKFLRALFFYRILLVVASGKSIQIVQNKEATHYW